MKSKTIKIEESKIMYLYDIDDVNERAEFLRTRIDNLIEYLSKNRDKFENLTMDDINSDHISELFGFGRELENTDEYDTWGLFTVVKEAIDDLIKVMSNVKTQEEYKDDLDEHYYLFKYI